MHFTLTYSGDLRANGGIKHKHDLRKAFHEQLATLWQQQPLVDYRWWFDGSKNKATINLKRKIGEFQFVPLISPDLYLICKLEIFMLRPGPPGAIINQGGDIDNRLKTLFDALRIPKEDELPKGVSPEISETPFFCLLEDDVLISAVSVQTDRLLMPTTSTATVHLDIQVTTQPTRTVVDNRVTGGFVIS